MATTTKGTRKQKVEVAEVKEVMDAVKDLDPAKVVAEVGTLQVSLQNTLAQLSAQITSKIQQMDTIDTAIKLKDARLKELHGIENEAISLDEMKVQKDEEKQNWEKDRAARKQMWDEEAALHKKTHQRELEEWEYNLAQKKKRAEEEFAASVENNKRAEQVRQEALNRQWTERETALKAKETEFNELQKQVAGFDARIKTELAKNEAVVTNALKRNYEYETTLLKKDADATKNLYEQKIGGMVNQISGLNTQIKDLHEQLIAARQDAKDVAAQALQSASERKVAEAYRHVVDSRETTANTKGK